MTLLITLCVICTALMLLLQRTAVPLEHPNRISGSEYRYSAGLVVVFFLVIAFISAFRYGFCDTGLYRDICGNMGADYGRLNDEDLPFDDIGFNYLMVFLNRMGFEPQSIIVVCAVVTFAVYLYILYKYSCDLPFSLFLLLFISYYGMINGIRQVLAGAIMFAAFPLLLKKRYLLFLPFVGIAYTIHASALVMLPLCFIITGRRMNLGIWGFIGVVSLFFIAPSLANSLLGRLLEDTTYQDYLNNTLTMGIVRLLVAAVPLVLAFFYALAHPCEYELEPGSRAYNEQRLSDVLINMLVVSFGFTVLGLRMVYFARISMYFEGAFLLFLPMALNKSFDPRSTKTIKQAAIALYFLYFLYQTYVFRNYGYFNDFYLVL